MLHFTENGKCVQPQWVEFWSSNLGNGWRPLVKGNQFSWNTAQAWKLIVLKPFIQILYSTCGLNYRECHWGNEPTLCKIQHGVAPQASKHTNMKDDSPLHIFPFNVPAKQVGYFSQTNMNSRPTALSGAYFFCCSCIEGKKLMHSEHTKMMIVQGYFWAE